MYHFIVNPGSRSGKGRQIWLRIKKILDRKSVAYRCYMTEYAGHARHFAEEISSRASREHPANIIVMGGDGTIHEVLTGIKDLKAVVFGFIPTGSGNDFCRGMNLPNDPVSALRVILYDHRIGRMDVPKIRFKTGSGAVTSYRFGISAGMGYDAAVCQEVQISSAKKILNRLGLGKLTYLYVALRQMIFQTPSSVKITLDENRRYAYDKMYFAAVMNQKYEGGGFKFCPLANTHDHILDVIVVEGIPKLMMLLALPSAFRGAHTHVPGIHIYRCRSIIIDSPLPLPVHVDGEPRGHRKKIAVTTETDQISIFLPE